MLGVVKRLKLEHNYHDATVRSMELSEGRLTLAVDLVPSSNHGIAEHRHLIFEGIRNEEELRQQLSTQPSNVRVEVIGVARVGPGRILVDLNTVSLELDCKLVVET
jgi:hypothetical protein